MSEINVTASETSVTSELCRKLRSIMRFAAIDQGATYTIGQMSSHLGVSLRTLRFYEQAGLLSPDRNGQRRLYSPADLERLEIIVTLRELEVSLAAIRQLFGAIDEQDPSALALVETAIAGTLESLLRDNVARINELEGINRRIADVRVGLAQD
ncbi:MerR family transcriptional regulator [Siculibacillus lacustris]|nr:MerR family transcriptional regulator [Siculibacillus lacustris]